MILDTSFIIDVMNGKRDAVEKLEELKKDDVSIQITSLTGYELHLGVRNSSKPRKEQKKIETFMDKILGNRIPYNWENGKKSAEIQSGLEDQGTMIEIPDILIAGITAESGEKILTRNTKHFKEIEGIKVESY